MKKPRLPKYRWWVMVPSSGTRHAVPASVSGNSVRAICGAESDADSFELTPARAKKHQVCGRCNALIERTKMMAGITD